MVIRQNLTEMTMERRNTLAHLAASMLNEKLDRMKDLGQSLASRVVFRHLIAAGHWERAMEKLKTIPKEFPQVDRILITDTRGILMADIPEVSAVHGTDFSYRDWYRGVSRDWKPYVSEVYTRAAEPKRNVVATAVPIRSEEGAVLGILVLQVRTETFFDWVSPLDVGEAGFIYAVDHKNRIVTHPAYPPQGDIVDYSASPAIRLLREKKAGVDVVTTPLEANEDRVTAYRQITGYDWGVVVVQPTRAAFRLRRDTIRRFGIVYGLLLLVNGALIALLFQVGVGMKRTQDDLCRFQDDLKAALAALENTKERLELSLDSAQMGLWILDLAHGTSMRTPQHDRIFGYADPLPQWGYDVFVSHVVPEDRDAVRARFETAYVTGALGLECRIARRDNGAVRWISCQGRVFRDARGKPIRVMGSITDVTDRKLIEEELARSNKELEQFAYIASHDLQEPLRKAHAFAQLLEEEFGSALDDTAKGYISRIRGSTLRMRNLIEGLLDYSRVTTHAKAFEVVDLGEVVKEVLSDLEIRIRQTKAGIDVGPMPTLTADRLQMRQLFQNLIGNALKFQKKDSPAPPRVIVTSRMLAGDRAEISVEDNGIGFEEQYAGRIFQPFQRLHGIDSEYEGSGMGLAICQKIVIRHKGTITARSVPDKGSTFVVDLPVTGG